MRNLKSIVKGAAVAMGLILAIGGTTGCDDGGFDTGFGGDDFYGSDWGYGGGYGPIDEDVFQASVDNFSEYLRG